MGIICLYVLIQKSGQKTAKSHLCAMTRNTLSIILISLLFTTIFLLADNQPKDEGQTASILLTGSRRAE